MKRSRRLRPRSAKRVASDDANRPARQAVIAAADGRCEIRDELSFGVLRRQVLRLGPDDVATMEEALRACTREAEGVHERRKRSSGGSLTERANLMAACNRCNGWVEDQPRIAHALGLAVRPGDEAWEYLGR